jgi:hypothetical protein
MIIMTPGGSYEYLGNYDSTGGFTPNAWVRTNLPLGSVQYFLAPRSHRPKRDIKSRRARSSVRIVDPSRTPRCERQRSRERIDVGAARRAAAAQLEVDARAHLDEQIAARR